jgi:hypothetical protein
MRREMSVFEAKLRVLPRRIFSQIRRRNARSFDWIRAAQSKGLDRVGKKRIPLASASDTNIDATP